MGIAFAVLGGIIGLTVVTGGVASYQTIQQGVFSNTTNTGGATDSWGQSGGATGSWAAVTPDNKIGKGAIVQWIDTKDIDPATKSPRVKTKAVTVKVDGQKLMDAARSNPAKYPKMSAASFASTVPTNLSGATLSNPADGKTYKLSSTPLVITGNYACNISEFNGFNNGRYWICTTPMVSNPIYGTYAEGYDLTLVATGTPTTSLTYAPATLPVFSSKLANISGTLSAPAGVFSDYYGEIDEYIKSNPGSVSIVDTPEPKNVSTAPLASLPTPATQTGVDAAIAKATAKAAAGSALQSANNSVGTAQSNYTANPTPENKLALDNAIAARDSLAAHQAENDAEDAEDSDEQDTGGFDSPAYGDKTDDELSLGNRFRAFFDQMRTTALFSLPNQFLSGLPSGGSSVISFSAGRFGDHTFDFSLFSSLWTTLKTIILVLFAWLGVRIVTLKGGGG